MKKITVHTDNPYDVLVGKGILKDIGKLARPLLVGDKVAVFTDDNVAAIYLTDLVKELSAVGYKVFTHIFPHGESTKCIARYAEGLDFLADNKFDRTDALVALGGGVIGDLTGFIAATYMRGIDYIQVPTSLLAQVDSSVGGKTAIDIAAGKNLVGAFYQPALVLADVDCIDTLPETELMNGIGEILKYAVLDGGECFELMQDDFKPHAERIIELSINIKRGIVEEDEKESGIRRLLNLGHTVAHAIEKLSGYTVGHGSAVATGITYILEASHKRGYLGDSDYRAIADLLTKYGVKRSREYNLSDICECASSDKKTEGAYINLVVVDGIGKCRTEKVACAKLEEYLS